MTHFTKKGNRDSVNVSVEKQRFTCEIPFLCATTATTTTEQRNNTPAEKEPTTRGQSTPDSSADITLALL